MAVAHRECWPPRCPPPHPCLPAKVTLWVPELERSQLPSSTAALLPSRQTSCRVPGSSLLAGTPGTATPVSPVLRGRRSQPDRLPGSAWPQRAPRGVAGPSSDSATPGGWQRHTGPPGSHTWPRCAGQPLLRGLSGITAQLSQEGPGPLWRKQCRRSRTQIPEPSGPTRVSTDTGRAPARHGEHTGLHSDGSQGPISCP